MNTPRRNLLGAIAFAPILTGPAVARAPARSDLSTLDVGALLERAARVDTDRTFADLCASAHAALLRSDAAYALAGDADRNAEAATPAFPAPLCYSVRYPAREGESDSERRVFERRWSPVDDKSGMLLWNLAHRYARTTGVPYRRDLQTELRANYDAWVAQRTEIEAGFQCDELDAAACAAGSELNRLIDAVLAYRPRTPDTLLTQLHLRSAECLLPDGEAGWRAIVADVARVLAA